jgi:hypothetical protein
VKLTLRAGVLVVAAFIAAAYVGDARAAALLTVSTSAPSSVVNTTPFIVVVTMSAGDAAAHTVNLQATPDPGESQLFLSGATCFGDGNGHENCAIGDLAPGASTSVSFTFSASNAPASLHNAFAASSPDAPTVASTANTTVQLPPPPPPQPDVTVTMSAAASVPEGGTLTTTDTITNNGPGGLDGINVSHFNDRINEVIVSASAQCVPGMQTTCQLGLLAAGSSVAVVVVSSIPWGTAGAVASESVSATFAYGEHYEATAQASHAAAITLGTPVLPPVPVAVLPSSSSPPVSVALPTFTGGGFYGAPLQATSLGTWRAVLPEFHWRWVSCDPSGANCGSADNRLDLNPGVVPQTSIGQTMRLEVGAIDAYGAWTWVDSAPGPIVAAFQSFPQPAPAQPTTSTPTPVPPTGTPTAAPSRSYGGLAGRVRDARGHVIPGALARLFSLARSTSVRTNAHGGFVFLKRAVGSYRLVVTHRGFHSLTMRVRVSAHTTVRVALVLRRT